MQKNPITKCFGALLCGLLAFSSNNLRFDSRHAKDDYRRAAAAAKTALLENKVVWWAADPVAAAYYKLPLSAEKLKLGFAFHYGLSNPNVLAEDSAPDIIFLSKTDIYDADGKLREFIQNTKMTLSARPKAFTVWTPSRVD